MDVFTRLHSLSLRKKVFRAPIVPEALHSTGKIPLLLVQSEKNSVNVRSSPEHNIVFPSYPIRKSASRSDKRAEEGSIECKIHVPKKPQIFECKSQLERFPFPTDNLGKGIRLYSTYANYLDRSGFL